MIVCLHLWIIYVCMCVYVCGYLVLYVHVFMYVCLLLFVCLYTHGNMRLLVGECICVYLCVCLYYPFICQIVLFYNAVYSVCRNNTLNIQTAQKPAICVQPTLNSLGCGFLL